MERSDDGGQQLTGSDDEERNKVAQLRAYVEKQDPSAKEVDNFMLRRFLRARDQNIDKASAMFLSYLNWRKIAVPNGFISEAEIKNDLSQKKVFLQGFDRIGRPILVGLIARHNCSKRNMDEFKRFCVYLLDAACNSMRGQEKFICILDFKGWGYSHCDIRAYLAALEIMQNRYPERLAKALLIHVPPLFMKAWKVIYPFIDDNTKKKFIFVDDDHLKYTLLEDIDESQLPEIYGGKLPLVPIEESKIQP